MTSTLEVSESRLCENLHAIQRTLAEATGNAAPTPSLLAVIKANGYGHSATLCARILSNAGADWLGVTDAEEGVAVRTALKSTTPAILIMSGPPGDLQDARRAAALAVEHHLTPVVWTSDHLVPLAEAAVASHPVHLEIDTGMSRQGVSPGDALSRLLKDLRATPKLHLHGVFTHLASAECADARQIGEQMQSFAVAVRAIAAAGFAPAWLHLGNASTIDNASPAAAPTLMTLHTLAVSIAARPLIRCGLGLYGLCLPLEPDPSHPAQSTQARLSPLLQPVLTWTAPVISVLELPPGGRIGYGATFTAPRSMRLALLPVGYADGLRRALSSTNLHPGGWVLIHGQRAPIVGRVSMNLTTVDVTDIQPAPGPGDRAVLLGPGISAQDHARLCDTVAYEILCGLRGRFLLT